MMEAAQAALLGWPERGGTDRSEACFALPDAIVRLLGDAQGDVGWLQSELELLGERHGDVVFEELLYLLAHLRFAPPEAARHWRHILELHEEMSRQMGFILDIRVALVSYFVDVSHKLKNPKVIELQLFQETQHHVYRDGLTGLYNYRYFREHLERELRRADRYGSTLSLLMIDVDDFKLWNDTRGHQAGNRALTEMASRIRAAVRDCDIPVRYGGEEFAVLLPSTSKDGALHVAERMREDIARHAFEASAEEARGSLTVSIGLATCPGDATLPETLVAAADKALYLAKDRGKDQVVPFGQCHRSYRRVRISLRGSLKLPRELEEPLETIDLSISGTRFRCLSRPAAASLVEIHLDLADGNPPLLLGARVLRVEDQDDGTRQVAARFLDLADPDRRRLEGCLAGPAPEA